MGKWETVETCGSPPSPRTCHSMVSVGSKFYVFGGGLSGPDPVPDTTLHVFNAGEIYNACKHLILHGISPHFTIVWIKEKMLHFVSLIILFNLIYYNLTPWY